MSVYEFADISITVNHVDVSADVIYAETSFQVAASAQPGTFSLSIRDPTNKYDFREGKGGIVTLTINGILYYAGYVLMVGHGYVFPNRAIRKWTLAGTDLNILLDRLIMYNHADPRKYPDGGGHWPREAVTVDGVIIGWVITIPPGTTDRDYIFSMMPDFDIPGGPNDPSGAPTIFVGGSNSLVEEVGTISIGAPTEDHPGGVPWTPPGAGTTLRSFMTDVSTNVLRQFPGSSIWYINPKGYLVYKAQEKDRFANVVGDTGADAGWDVRDLAVNIDISHIKNDVLIFTGKLDPTPTSTETMLRYKHNSITASVSRFGRFQYSEVLGSDWLQGMVNARSTKVLFQEGGPAVSADFTIYRSGIEIGQLLTIRSNVHSYYTFDPTFGDVQGGTIEVPVRAIDISFVEPNVVAYRVTCSYDTQDPWGLLMALKRSPNRGIVQPNFNVIDLRPGRAPGPPEGGNPLPPATPMAFVKEYPKAASGSTWQCHYAYIRNSLTVTVMPQDKTKGGKRLVSFPVEDDTSGFTAGFIETDPLNGQFKTDPDTVDADAGDKVFAEYHIWANLGNTN